MESFNHPDEATEHELGRRLFGISGVKNVFIMPNFLTITKDDQANWKKIEASVEDVVEDYLASR